ncbi:Hypothetical predicted protein [Marmota monax]|uniref:Uncharacterized protein n=1 Tax=Marmota monax TaxID=9995 RepID=A0A5E4BQ55_MARMO|nr:hypothetical protein GHT09_016871 [Marmota monax]VTJ71773.1 Hypothetical predicted protein [Marmota monax]
MAISENPGKVTQSGPSSLCSCSAYGQGGKPGGGLGEALPPVLQGALDQLRSSSAAHSACRVRALSVSSHAGYEPASQLFTVLCAPQECTQLSRKLITQPWFSRV